MSDFGMRSYTLPIWDSFHPEQLSVLLRKGWEWHDLAHEDKKGACCQVKSNTSKKTFCSWQILSNALDWFFCWLDRHQGGGELKAKVVMFGPCHVLISLRFLLRCKRLLSLFPLFNTYSHAYRFPGGSEGKESACNAVNPGSIPGSGRSPGEGNGNPLQYSCLENPMDGGAWWATVHGVAKSRTWLSAFPSHFQ